MYAPDRWHEVDRLFAAALDRPPEERAAFLDEACSGDEALHRAVEELLSTGVRGSSPLDMPLAERSGAFWRAFAGDLKAPQRQASEGDRIGAYRILREIGRGGMGVVYLAERADGQFEQRVALKLLRRGVETEEALRRFSSERQILASLQHPNIARLYDGGTTDDGRPYFVMEYVSGRPIDRYCDEARLSVDERLELFRRVCDAVHYAHQSLVVHRDLKPSNILVKEEEGEGEHRRAPGTHKGVPLLLDFGIAKLLRTEEASGSPTLTRTGVHVLTPSYASPEQMQGKTITTASDVYQLGLVLYELLTGRCPYRVKGRTPSEVERVVCEQIPARPSMAVTQQTEMPVLQAISEARRTRPERLQKKLRGDLDTIVMKALRKEPGRRYASVKALADDLRRHQEGLPVTARPDTMTYRARKFVQRHRWGVAVSALIMLLLLGGLTGTAWQARRASRQAQLAAEEARKAEQVTAFLMGLFEASDPTEALGDTITARVLLERGVERAEALEGQPAVQAQMLSVIGRVYSSLGVYDRAAPLLERALEMRQTLYGNAHRLTADSRIYLAEVLHYQGKYHEAGPLFEAAVATYRDLPNAITPEYATSLDFLVGFHDAMGNYAVAESLAQEEVEVNRALYGSKHLKVAASLNVLGLMLSRQGKVAAAEAHYRDALAIHRARGDNDHPALAATLVNLGMLLQQQQDYAAAEPLLREALAMRRRLYGPTHAWVGMSLMILADVLRDQGDWGAAERHYREAHSILRAAYGANHPLTATVLVNWALLKQRRGDDEQAVALLQDALVRFRKTLPEDHSRVARARRELVACLTRLRRYEEAEQELLTSYTVLKGEGDAQTVLEALARLYDTWGKPEEAARYQALLAGAETEQ